MIAIRMKGIINKMIYRPKFSLNIMSCKGLLQLTQECAELVIELNKSTAIISFAISVFIQVDMVNDKPLPV